MGDTDPFLGALIAGRFRVEGLIARGGMGAVYRAVQLPLGRTVALKLIGDRLHDDVARRRFEREARLAASISDPRIVSIYDFGVTDDGVLFLAMELVEGETLRQRLQRGALPWREAFALARDVAAGLGAAHQRGLVHRDIKPENIMRTQGVDGLQNRILDFGLAKQRSDLLNASTGGLTQDGTVVGTPGYIAPEVMNGADAEDPRQDVYALGILLWECLTGRNPFASETPFKTIVRGMQEDVPPLSPDELRRSGTPPEGAALLATLCARDPSLRPPDGSAVVAAFARLAAQQIKDETRETRATPRPTPSWWGAGAQASLPSLPHDEVTEPEANLPASILGIGRRPRRSTLALVAAFGSISLVVVAALLVVQRTAPLPRVDDRSAIAAAEAELTSGNASAARVHLKAALQHNDAARARSLWSAAAASERELDVTVDGRLTDAVFIDDQRLAVSNRNHSIDIFDLRSAESTRLRDHQAQVTALAAADGVLFSCDTSGVVRRWDGQASRSRQGSLQGCTDVDALGAVAWAAATNEVMRWADEGGQAYPQTVLRLAAIDEDRQFLAEPHGLRLWSRERGVLDSVETASVPYALCPTAADRRSFYVGLNDGAVLRIDIEGDALLEPTTVRRHGARIEALATTRDGHLLASAASDSIVQVGPPDAVPWLRLLDAPSAPIGLAFSPSGERLAVISRDRVVVFRMDALLSARRTAQGHTRTVEALDVLGDAVWSGGADGVVVRWDVATARGQGQMKLGSTIEDLDVSPDGKLLALALSDGRAMVLDPHTGRQLGGWVHSGGATSVRFSTDGQTLVSGGRDGRVFLASAPFGDAEPVAQFPDGVQLWAVDISGGPGEQLVGVSGQGGLVQVLGPLSSDRRVAPAARALTSNGCGTGFALRFDPTADVHGGVLSVCNDGVVERRLPGSAPAAAQDAALTVASRIYDIDVHDRLLAAAGSKGAWLRGTRGVRVISSVAGTNRVRFSPSADAVVTAADDGTVRRFALDGVANAWDVDVKRVLGSRATEAMSAVAGVRAMDHDDHVVCVATEKALHMWSDAVSEEVVGVPDDDPVVGVAAFEGTCVLATRAELRRLRNGVETAPPLHLRPTAIGRDGARTLVAAGAGLVSVDGQPLVALEAGAPVTALAGLDGVILIGRADGSAALIRGGRVEPLALVDAPTSAPSAAVFLRERGGAALPAFGFEDGTVAVWDPKGQLVDRTRLHGRVARLDANSEGLLAVTELGDSDVRLPHLNMERCELLWEVWDATGGAGAPPGCPTQRPASQPSQSR